MKKITFLLVLVFCLTATNIYGKQISIDEAQSLALNHMRRNHDPRLHGAAPATQQLELVLEAKSNSLDVDYYVFNKGKCDGYIIVSGDDKAAPILGFSDEGTFDINNIPDGLQYWLEVYSHEMQYLRSNPNAPAALQQYVSYLYRRRHYRTYINRLRRYRRRANHVLLPLAHHRHRQPLLRVQCELFW